MKPAEFDYLRPETAAEALAALARHGEHARVLAGGQSLMPMLNMRLAQPALLVDIAPLDELGFVRTDDDALVIGAAITQTALAARAGLADEVPLLALALPWVGHWQTRNRGTICGSIAHADPSAELPLCLVALGGEVMLRSARQRRTVAASTFFTGMLSTSRRPDELIEAVRFPQRQSGAGYAFREMAMRHGDFAIAAIAATVTATAIRVAVGGVADRPVARDWPDLTASALDDALNELARELGASDDAHATASYRRMLVRRVGKIVVEEARQCRR